MMNELNGDALGPSVVHKEDVRTSHPFDIVDLMASILQPVDIVDIIASILLFGQKSQHGVKFGWKSTYLRKQRTFHFNTKIHTNIQPKPCRSPKVMEQAQGGGYSLKGERSVAMG
jgi:hypothetical protein